MNREAERQRLVELIKDSLIKHIGKSCLLAENIADHLLDNGVIVPGCKLGQKTYSNHGMELDEVRGFMFEECCGEGCLDYVLDWNYGDYSSFTDDDIGKTVFLTREEAEAKLKGGAE